MTRTVQLTPDWANQTVAVLATGPSLTPALAEAARAQAHRVIVVNAACALAPWADALVAMDAHWPPAWQAFQGIRITGVDQPDLDAWYIGPRWERVQLAPGHVIEVRNSGLTAVRVAAAMGATTILLGGYDQGDWRHFDDAPAAEGDASAYIGVAEGLQAIVAELRGCGVIVEQLAAPAAEAPVAPSRKRGSRV